MCRQRRRASGGKYQSVAAQASLAGMSVCCTCRRHLAAVARFLAQVLMGALTVSKVEAVHLKLGGKPWSAIVRGVSNASIITSKEKATTAEQLPDGTDNHLRIPSADVRRGHLSSLE